MGAATLGAFAKGAGVTDNTPTLYRNAMDGLPSDLARELFLWATERTSADAMLYKAEAFARQSARLIDRVLPMLALSAAQHGRASVDPDLVRFIILRHANDHFGGNIKSEGIDRAVGLAVREVEGGGRCERGINPERACG